MHEKAKKQFDTFAISEIIIIFAHEDSTVALGFLTINRLITKYSTS